MSCYPYFLNELLNELDRPTLYDQHFGLGLQPYERVAFHPYERALASRLRTGYSRPWRNLDHTNSGVSNIVNDKDAFKVNLDVQQFKPDELNVKVVDDYISIEGKHEERSDEHGFISRQFTRRYKLPSNVDKLALTSSLSSDGVLQLHAPKKLIEGAKARTVPVIQTNKPAVKAADPKKEGQMENMES